MLLRTARRRAGARELSRDMEQNSEDAWSARGKPGSFEAVLRNIDYYKTLVQFIPIESQP
ncbi:hypothetical protein D9754_04760 [Planomicrobium sp. Y74]|nr:hypothetical protein D9754_04760 [Planomicrobium sp. Y74]